MAGGERVHPPNDFFLKGAAGYSLQGPPLVAGCKLNHSTGSGRQPPSPLQYCANPPACPSPPPPPPSRDCDLYGKSKKIASRPLTSRPPNPGILTSGPPANLQTPRPLGLQVSRCLPAMRFACHRHALFSLASDFSSPMGRGVQTHPTSHTHTGPTPHAL